MNRINRFAWFSWGLLAYNLLVILWGAYVRATGSGAGCGAHWPLCNGQVIPEAVRAATWIEFTHRVMSGLTLAFAIGLAVWAWRSYNRGSPARLGASLVLFFTVTEALVGAGLVLFSLVEKNASVTRAISVAVHLANTLLLLGAVTLTAWWASGGEMPRLRGQGITGLLLVLGLAGIILVSASGAITALGDTLFPSGSLAEGVQQDFLPTAHFLIRLRIYHPVIAVLMGVYVTSVAVLTSTRRPGRLTRRFAIVLVGLFGLQVALGLLNVYLLAPVWLQMVHLLAADLVWIFLVLLSAAALSLPQAQVQVPREAPELSKAQR